PLATLMSALACVFVVTLAPAGALAAGPSPVPLPGFFDMAVDNVHQHVFVSAGPGGPGVAVLGFDGSLLRIIEPKGASGLALDAGELYVAASDAAEIDVVDTATLSVTGSIPLGDWTQPGDVLIANGLVWFFGQLPGVTIVELASVRPDGTEAPHGAAGPVGGTSPRFVEGAGGDEFLYMF